MKIRIPVFACAMIAAGILAAILVPRIGKATLIARVREGLPELSELSEKIWSDETISGPPWVHRVWTSRETQQVLFDVFAFGIAPSGSETGFFYSCDGDPHPYPGMESYREIATMFGWHWEEVNGDNGCYVEHIEGNSYYYKAWF